jgi:type VI protein secretion system component Hcp
MPLSSFLSIRAAGEDAPVLFGEDVTIVEMGGVDVSTTVECLEFEVAVEVGGSNDPRRAGRPTWRPARFLVRQGKSTPWLFDALRKNASVDLTLRGFHQDAETGEVKHHLQYRVREGRLAAVRLHQPGDDDLPAFAVELQVTPGITEIESITGGTLMVDQGRDPR